MRLLWPIKYAQRLRDHVCRRKPNLVIGTPEHIYMRRWWIIPRNPVFNIYLHQFLRSDDDRALHDHPYANVSWLIDGGYIEHTIRQGGVHEKVERKAGDIAFRLPWRAHRIELWLQSHSFAPVAPTSRPCWTIFVTGPRVRKWGFCYPKRWVPHDEFGRLVDGQASITKGCGD